MTKNLWQTRIGPIEAMQWRVVNKTEMAEFTGEEVYVLSKHSGKAAHLRLHTPRGTLTVPPQWWVVKGPASSGWYALAPEDFDAAFEPYVEPTESVEPYDPFSHLAPKEARDLPSAIVEA